MADLAPFSRITRIQPFTGLVIDPPTWGAIHDYHRLHQRLHLISLHGSGIAQGLAVLPTDPPGGAVVVEPGVAVDDAGEVIVVPERERVTIDARAGSAYLALAFHEATPARTDGAPEVDPQEARGAGWSSITASMCSTRGRSRRLSSSRASRWPPAASWSSRPHPTHGRRE